MTLLKKVVVHDGGATPLILTPMARVNVHKPKSYKGNRSAMEGIQLPLVHGEVLPGYQCWR